MPKINFSELPREIRRHLIRRIHQRLTRGEEIEALLKWVYTQPKAPDGDWYKDFGSFKLCGRGAYPKTILTEDMQAFGQEIE
jgi:hypothetical protein